MAATAHPTIDSLKRTADAILAKSMEMLARHGNFDPAILLLGPCDHVVQLPFDPGWMNCGSMKERLFGAVRFVAREAGAKAVYILTDGFAVSYSDEEKRRLSEDREAAEEYFAKVRDACDIDEAVAAGFGRKVEAIIITVQSPLYSLIIQQHYERSGPKHRRISFGEKVVIDSAEGGRLTGRMAIWDEGAGAA